MGTVTVEVLKMKFFLFLLDMSLDAQQSRVDIFCTSALQADQSTTHALLLWSHTVVTSARCVLTLSCWNKWCCWKRHHLDGSTFLKNLYAPFSIICAYRFYILYFTIQGTYITPDHHNCWLLNFILLTVWMVPVLFRRTWHPWFSKAIWVVDWNNHVCVFIHSFVDSFIHWLMLFVMDTYMIQSNITCVDLMEWFYLAQGLFVFCNCLFIFFTLQTQNTLRTHR